MPATFIYQRKSEQPAENPASGDAMRRSGSFFRLDDAEYREVQGSSRRGEGGFGAVREFQRTDGAVTYAEGDEQLSQTMFVKSCLEPDNHTMVGDAQRELLYYQNVYPQLGVYLSAGSIADYRLVMPDLGLDFYNFSLANIDDANAFRELALSALHELSRIHGLGYIHSDIATSNIMVRPGNQVYFIDGSFFVEAAKCSDLSFSRRREIARLMSGLIATATTLFGYNVFSHLDGVYDIDTAIEKLNAEKEHNLKQIKKTDKAHLQNELRLLKATALELGPTCPDLSNLVLSLKNALVEDQKYQNIPVHLARAICQQTTALLSGPATSKDAAAYLKLADQLEAHAPCTTYTRRISKAMLIIGTAMLIAGLTASCLGAPVAAVAGVAIFVSLVSLLSTLKGGVQSSIEDLAAQKEPSTLAASGMRLKHTFS